MTPNTRTRILPTLAIASSFLILAASARAQTPTTAPAQSVVVPGSVEAFWSADLFAKTSGYVTEVKKDIGDHVTQNDVLAVLHVPELDKSLIQAKATLRARKQMLRASEAAIAQAKQALAVSQQQLASYKAEAAFQQVTFKRQQELSAGNAATPQQLDEARSKAEVSAAGVGIGEAKAAAAEADIQAAEANRDVAAAQVEVAEAGVQEVDAMLEYTRLVAPFDGVITRRQVSPGDLVQAATTSRTSPLFTIQKVDTVRVFCDVPESKAAGVAVHAPVEVKLYGLDGQVVRGEVTRLASSLNPVTRTMRAEIDLDNPKETLRPGMYAQVTITLGATTKPPQPTTKPAEPAPR